MSAMSSKVMKTIVEALGSFGDSMIEKGCLFVLYQPKSYRRGEFRKNGEEKVVDNE